MVPHPSHRLAFVRCESPDGNLMPPLGVLYLAALAEMRGWSVDIFDEHERKDRLLDDLVAWGPDLVGFSCVTSNFNRSSAVAAALKMRITPSPPIIFGGPHPTLCPIDTLQSAQDVDYVMVGESEGSFPQFLDFLTQAEGISEAKGNEQEVDNLVYRTSQGTAFTRAAPLLTDAELDSLPWPAFHLLNLDFYFRKMQHGLFSRGERGLPLMATRGCPHSCTFCCRIMGKGIRRRSPGNVVAELKHMLESYHIDSVYFEDDNFTFDMDYAKDVLRLIIGQTGGSLFIKFANGLRVDRMDDELLDLMKIAGVYHLSFGVESGSRTTLSRMKKHLNLETTEKIINQAKLHGFLVGANCILGYPEESLADLRESVSFFLKMPLDTSAIVNVIPFPTTELERYVAEKGLLTELANNYDNYYFRLFRPNILIKPTRMKMGRLGWEIKRAYLLFYLRPRILGRIVFHVVRQSMARLMARIRVYRPATTPSTARTQSWKKPSDGRAAISRPAASDDREEVNQL